MSADFNRIVYFLHVCEHGSISKAAERLYISPQALNKQMRVLEKELGKKLFQHTARPLTLTNFGAFFRNQMQPVYQLYQNAQIQVEHYLDATKRTIHVSFFQGIPKRQVIQPVIAELMAGLPEAQIELVSAEMDEIYADLRSKKTDIAITYINPIETFPELIQIPLLKLPSTIVVSELHPWIVRETIGVEDMAAAPVLLLSRANGPDKEGFYGSLQAASYHYASGYNAMLAQLGLGQHYAVFPTGLENLSEIGLKAFPLPEEYRSEFCLSLIYRPDSPFSDFFSTLSVLKDDFREMYDFGRTKRP